MTTVRDGRGRRLIGVALAALTVATAACSSTPVSSGTSTSSTTSTASTGSTTSTTVPTSSSATTTTSPGAATGPSGGVIPADFEPSSFTAVSLDEWWLLGTARCIVASGICDAIVRTTDGGSSFAGIPSPPVSAGEVTQLRFANALDGYAFDPELWDTTDGGASWAKVAMPGPVTEVEAAGGEAYALTCAAGSTSCQSMSLLRSSVGSRDWLHVSTAPLSFGSQFAVGGTNLYLLTSGGHPVLVFSADRGTNLSQRVDPCSAALDESVTAAADGSATLWAACPSGTEAQTLLSSNGGTTWQARAGGFANGLQLAGASPSVALAWPAQEGNGATSGALERTTNGGSSFSVVLSGSSSRVSWAGFSDPVRCYALLASSSSTASGSTRLFESNDGGATWNPVVIKS